MTNYDQYTLRTQEGKVLYGSRTKKNVLTHAKLIANSYHGLYIRDIKGNVVWEQV